MKRRTKLIETGMPLRAINEQSQREKSIRHGHPSTLHLWWSRKPLAACRAVLFASLVDDPSACPEDFPTEEAQAKERKRLHEIIEGLVRWETTDETLPDSAEILAEARYEVAKSVARTEGQKPPANDPDAVARFFRESDFEVYDPFAGGGSIPLEAQRLGVGAVASDLNPVPVLINRAMIEIPPKFHGKPPVNPTVGTEIAQAGRQAGRQAG